MRSPTDTGSSMTGAAVVRVDGVARKKNQVTGIRYADSSTTRRRSGVGLQPNSPLKRQCVVAPSANGPSH